MTDLDVKSRIDAPLPSPSAMQTTAMLALFAVSVAWLAIRSLMFRDAILMSDEYYYAKTCQLWFAHQQDLRTITSIPGRGEAGFPNSLFFWIYRLAFAFGGDFYLAAKLLNVLFATATALAVRAVARVFLSDGAAWLIAALSLWMPATSYLSYLMPEALYECCVWWGLAAFFRLLRRGLPQASTALGALLGAALLAKPNAAALLVACNVVVVIVGWRTVDVASRRRQVTLALIGINVAFVGVGYLLNVITTGHLTWDPAGKFYRVGLAKVAEVDAHAAYLTVFAKYLFAYCWVVLAVFGPAVIVLAAGRWRGTEQPARIALTSFVVVGVSALLLGSVKVAVNWERVFVNHVGVYSTRYISVLFPLVVIAFFDGLPRALDARRVRRVIGVGAAVATLALGAVYMNIENPLQMRELFWPQTIAYRLGIPLVLCGLAATTIYYGWADRPSARLYAVVLAGFAGLSTVGLLRADRQEMAIGARAIGQTARAVQDLVRPELYDKGFVVADRSKRGAQFMFRFPGIVPFKVVPRHTPLVSLAALVPRPDWVVLLDDLRADSGVECRPLPQGVLCPLTPGVLVAEGTSPSSRPPAPAAAALAVPSPPPPPPPPH